MCDRAKSQLEASIDLDFIEYYDCQHFCDLNYDASLSGHYDLLLPQIMLRKTKKQTNNKQTNKQTFQKM